MKLLIIKNDGFGDFILVKNQIKNINKKYYDIDIVISKNNEILTKDIENIKNKIVFDYYGPNFSYNNKISGKDKLKLSNLKKKKYDLCIVLRRYLNDEQVLILNEINAKSIILCHEFFSSREPLKCNFKKVKISKNLLNDYDYFNTFLKKINLIKKEKIKISSKLLSSKNYLVLNLSGERQFKNIENLKLLINIIKKNYNKKTYIIGKTLNNEMNIKINNLLRKINSKKLINLWSKSNFSSSMNLINHADYYIGFNTGLSHYASMINIKSLIILDSGGNNKWFPYPESMKKNISYWTYNTPCAGCNYAGNQNKCFYDTRFCVDNIFDNNKKLEIEFNNFLLKKNNYVNFSKYNFFISDWTVKEKKKDYFI